MRKPAAQLRIPAAKTWKSCHFGGLTLRSLPNQPGFAPPGVGVRELTMVLLAPTWSGKRGRESDDASPLRGLRVICGSASRGRRCDGVPSVTISSKCPFVGGWWSDSLLGPATLPRHCLLVCGTLYWFAALSTGFRYCLLVSGTGDGFPVIPIGAFAPPRFPNGVLPGPVVLVPHYDLGTFGAVRDSRWLTLLVDAAGLRCYWPIR